MSTQTATSNVEWVVLNSDELPDDAAGFKKTFGKHIIGQPNAEAIALSAYERANNPLRDLSKPIGVYVLIGPSRTGKSKTAKVMAKAIHEDEEALTVLEASEYGEEHQMLDLVGAAPTYIGYQSPEAVRKLKPEDIDGTSKVSAHNMRRVRQGSKSAINIVLINEFEKATPEFYRYWMGAFDNGFTVHGNGMKTDFSKTIFILTMNLGMEQLKDIAKGKIGFGGGPRKVEEGDVKGIVDTAMKARFKKEFLNRLTAVVIFRPLSRDQILQICGREIEDIQERIDSQIPARHSFTLTVTPTAQEFIVAETLKDDGDVAELKRVVEREIADRLGRELSKKTIKGGDFVVVDMDENGAKLMIKVEKSHRISETLPALPAVPKKGGRQSEPAPGGDPIAAAAKVPVGLFEDRLDAEIERLQDKRVARQLYAITFLSEKQADVTRLFARLRQELGELFGDVPVISMYLFNLEPYTACLTVETSLAMIHLIQERYRHAQIALVKRAPDAGTKQ